MDSSFNGSPSMFNKGAFTSSRIRQSSVSSAMSGRKSMHAGLKKGIGSSRFSLAGRSGSGASVQPLTKSDLMSVYPFGLPLPVLVNEALTFGDRNATVTISCSANGWAWAVAGRRLLVWQHTSGASASAAEETVGGRLGGGQRRAPPTGQCRELTLPHCDIGHKAALVCVFLGDGGGGGGQQMASCLAVSPAGDCRYWPSIAHDGSSIDAASVLDGQEFDSIAPLPGVGYVLATTTCNLLLLQLQLNQGRHTIVQRPLKAPTGFLGGFGKRFASIIIGMNSNQEREHKFIKLCVTPAPRPASTSSAATITTTTTSTDWHLTVLADRWIQRWSLSAATESHLFEDFDMFKKIHAAFHQKLWSQRDAAEIEVRLLDMHATDSRTVIVLATAINAAHTPQFHYALCTFAESNAAGGAANSYALQNFCQLRHTTFMSATSPTTTTAKIAAVRLLVDERSGCVFVHDERCVLQVQLSGAGQLCGSGEPSDRLEWQAGERTMTGALCDRLPVFFLRQSGFVCVRPTGEAEADAGYEAGGDFLNGSSTTLGEPGAGPLDNTLSGQFGDNAANLSMFTMNPDEVYDDSDAVAQLKAAFIYHLKKNPTKCSEVLAELLDSPAATAANGAAGGGGGGSDCGTGLDAIVTKIARDLVDDVPASDPRWEERQFSAGHQQQQQATSAALGSSTSVQIIQQLKEKKLVLQHFVDFLHTVELWPRLTVFADRSASAAASGASAARPTGLILADIAEKCVAAIALKKIHAHHARLLDAAIAHVLRQREESLASGSLTAQDLFYVRVSRVHEIVRVLVGLVGGGNGAGDAAAVTDSVRLSADLADVASLVLAMLAEVHKSRAANYAQYAIPAAVAMRYEYAPWTAQTGRAGLRDAVQQLVAVVLKGGARATGDPELRQRHYRQMVELVDYVLDARKSFLDSVMDTDKYSVLLQQYEAQRADLIQPLVQDGQFELAAKLAEKYLDFQTLVQICDATENQQRLDEYIRKYQHLQFSQFAINWHMRQNKRGDLFERFKHQQADLARFLADHPSMAWVQAVVNGDLGKAGRVLGALAEAEVDLVARKKTMLSLAKLVVLADGGEEDGCVGGGKQPQQQQQRQLVAEIDADLKLLAMQATLPAELLEAFGYEAGEQKVLKPWEIINLLICEENTAATEADFRRALELLVYLDEPEDTQRQIWCAAILRDDWTRINVNAAQDELQNLMFFKLVDMCFFLDADLFGFLLPMETFLISPELESVAGNKSFQFLFKLGYEYINESYAQRM